MISADYDRPLQSAHCSCHIIESRLRTLGAIQPQPRAADLRDEETRRSGFRTFSFRALTSLDGLVYYGSVQLVSVCCHGIATPAHRTLLQHRSAKQEARGQQSSESDVLAHPRPVLTLVMTSQRLYRRSESQRSYHCLQSKHRSSRRRQA